jgi:hypothetical protein
MSDETDNLAEGEATEVMRDPAETIADAHAGEEARAEAEKTEVTERPAAPHSPLARIHALFPEAIGAIDHLVGALLGLVYVVWLMATSRSLGFGRDEGVYFHAGADYGRWFELLLKSPRRAIERGAIDPSWSNNHEHPALMKSLFGLSHSFFYDKLHLFHDASDAFRLPGMLMGGLALWVTYLFGARHFSRRAGVISAALLALMVRVFFHAHLACFDVPIMTMWTLSIYVYWRACQTRGLGWAVASGLVYGLTLETKHNAWILPLVYLVHTAFVDGRRILRELSRGRISIPAQLVFIAILGPAVFILLWPWLWNDTLPRIQEYAEFHLNHEYYNIEFLHQNYFSAPSPRLYAPFLILATVPLVTLVLFLIGAWDRLRALVRGWWPSVKAFVRSQAVPRVATDSAGTDLLLFLAFCAPIAPFILLSKTPIFGGTKHWMPAYPFLALFAGRGFDLTWNALRRAWTDGVPALRERVNLLPYAQAALVALVLAAPLAEVIHSHPFGLSAYTPIVGGTAGGADLGLNRQFWGYTTENVGPWLEANAPKGSSIFIHDTAWDAWNRMVDEKRVPPTLRAVGNPSEAAFALVHHELHMAEVDDQIWMAYGERAPAYVLTHDGVPIVSVYRR